MIDLEERQYKILLVEDDPVNIGIIVESLGDIYQLFIAKTRERAFKLLDGQRVDIILLDINLPDGNGFEICKTIIDNKHEYGDPSIVFMTGLDKAEDEARGIEIGARDYITKPINTTVLKARLSLQTQLIRQTELLSNLARIDGTTEVNNRRAFDDQLQIEWNRALRESTQISLCLLDIDYFKPYNDTYGHPAGDRCLKSLAKSLSSSFRRSTDFVARYGGEEFAVIMYKADEEIASRLLNQALEAFQSLKIPHSGSNVSEYVSFSAGICCTTPSAKFSALQLLEQADKLLYKAKESGRAQVCSGALADSPALDA